MEKYDKDAYLDTTNTTVFLEDFIDRELIHFSNYDCQRSIPNMVDGLKISQRKILYVAFKRNLTEELKVAQFAAAISELSSYHHGENSLVGAVIGMAQDYVGSNNVNLLEPKGQFGTRLQSSGSDHASERYIFTNLTPGVTRALFPVNDDAILHYLDDDGFKIEPQFYIPILPFVLFNGIKGIGTGFSTSIEPHNPLDILTYIRHRLSGDDTDAPPTTDFIPYYEGFIGTVTRLTTNKYLIKGCYEVVPSDAGRTTVRITELPIGMATDPYKEILETMAEGSVTKDGKKIDPVIRDFVNVSTDKVVNISVIFPKGEIDKLEADVDANGINGLERLLKLTTTVSNTNMHLFRADLKLHKYGSIVEIIDDFMTVRLDYYDRRKKYLIAELEALLVRLSNRARYIQYCLADKIDLRKKSDDAIDALLGEHGFVEIDDSFDYLIKMPMNSVSIENVERILREEADKRIELEALRRKALSEIWLDELAVFEKVYDKYRTVRDNTQKGREKSNRKVVTSIDSNGVGGVVATKSKKSKK